MPRPLRAMDDGLIYHLIHRGNDRQDVFHQEDDFQASQWQTDAGFPRSRE